MKTSTFFPIWFYRYKAQSSILFRMLSLPKLLFWRTEFTVFRFRCRPAQQRPLCASAASAALSELAVCRASVYRSRRVRRAEHTDPVANWDHQLSSKGRWTGIRSYIYRHQLTHRCPPGNENRGHSVGTRRPGAPHASDAVRSITCSLHL